MLGELYRPKGPALETARVVLEVDEPYACNVAWGCLNRCAYCYVPKVARQKRTMMMRLPKKPPVDLVGKQFKSMSRRPEGVFLSFLTDPFLVEDRKSTEDLISFLLDEGVKVATLSKLSVSFYYVCQGMTIVSLEGDFWKKFEPNTIAPRLRLDLLEDCKSHHDFVWVSMEPYPPSVIYKQDIRELLEELSFVDLIVFGKWNYDSRAKTEEARREYCENITILTDFCKDNNIRLHVKSDTLRFVKGEKAKS